MDTGGQVLVRGHNSYYIIVSRHNINKVAHHYSKGQGHNIIIDFIQGSVQEPGIIVITNNKAISKLWVMWHNY